MMKKALLSCLAVFVCALLLLGLMDSVVLFAINQNDMARLFEEHARLPKDREGMDYSSVAGQLITYLKSGDDRLLPQEAGASLFSEKENAHLKDCSALVRGLMTFRTVFLCLLTASLAFAATAVWRGMRRETLVEKVLTAFSRASAVLAMLFAALIVWGLMDFNSLFLAFHRVFFNNQLWLLDPGKDLLIQLMPESFFRAYAGRILTRLLPVLLMMLAVPFLRRGAKTA